MEPERKKWRCRREIKRRTEKWNWKKTEKRHRKIKDWKRGKKKKYGRTRENKKIYVQKGSGEKDEEMELE